MLLLRSVEVEVLFQRVQHQHVGTDDNHVHSNSSCSQWLRYVHHRVALCMDYRIPGMDKFYHVLEKVFFPRFQTRMHNTFFSVCSIDGENTLYGCSCLGV